MCGGDTIDLCPPYRGSEHTSHSGYGKVDFKSVMAIVWAVPIRPDRLGYALSMYAKKMKRTYYPLQRFSKCVEKSGNFCSNIPPEVFNMIKDYVYALDSTDDEFRRGDGKVEGSEAFWVQGYLCSQDACSDCQHVTKEVRENYARAFDKEFGMDNFDYGDPFPWEVDSDYSDGSEEHTRFFEEREYSAVIGDRGGGTRKYDHDYKEQITAWIMQQNDFNVNSNHKCNVNSWLKLFDQRPQGYFARLDMVYLSPPNFCRFPPIDFHPQLGPQEVLRARGFHLNQTNRRVSPKTHPILVPSIPSSSSRIYLPERCFHRGPQERCWCACSWRADCSSGDSQGSQQRRQGTLCTGIARSSPRR
jgi:hypothetical protein